MPDGLVKAIPFEDLIAAARARSQDGWRADLNDQAKARYHVAGWPHARTESWKYTNLNALAGSDFTLVEGGAATGAAVPEDAILAIDAPPDCPGERGSRSRLVKPGRPAGRRRSDALGGSW